jgi:hypothetical protein
MATVTYLKSAFAQVFKVSVPAGVTGLYMTAAELYFGAKSNTFGVEVSIVQMFNGFPDTTQVMDGSAVVIQPEMVWISPNAAASTKFYFNKPVYLSADARYALVISALGGSPDYSIFTGMNGQPDIATGLPISTNPLAEKAYFAKNNATWTAIPNETLKFRLYRARFRSSTVGTAVFKKADHEIIQVNNKTLASGTPKLQAGDEVYGLDAAGLLNANVYAKVVSSDGVNNLLRMKTTKGTFAANQAIMVVRSSVEAGHANTTTWGGGTLMKANVSSMYIQPIHAIVPKFGDASKSGTSSSMYYKGAFASGGGYAKDPTWMAVQNNNETEFTDYGRFVLPRSSEVASLSSNSSVDIKIDMSSSSDFISPVFDLAEEAVLGIQNLIGANTTGEDTDNGYASTRYISKTITLGDGQDAQDLSVYITAYKPPSTNLLVYGKFWNAEDPDPFDSKAWTLMNQATSAAFFCDPKNVEDFREYEFQMPTVDPASSNNITTAWDPPLNNPSILRYVSTTPLGNTAPFFGFKKYAIKVVMTVTDPTQAHIYPKLSNIRGIATQR